MPVFLRPTIAAICFLPAGIGLLVQAVQSLALDDRLLFGALLIMCVEQAHMARVDLQQIEAVKHYGQIPQLQPFRQVVVGTIVVELLGFYLAAGGFPGWGALVILGSLIGFNLVAKIRLTPHGPTPVSVAGITTRLDVLMIDAIAVGLVLLWLTDAARLLAAAILLGLTLLYEVSKLVTYVSQSLAQPSQEISEQ
jgi:hypothetical protein